MTIRHTLVGTAVALALTLLAACGGEEATEPSVEAFCDRLAPLAGLGSQLESPETDLAGLAEQVSDLAAVAPIAVQPSVESIASAIATMAAAAEASGESGAAANAAAFAAIAGEVETLNRASSVVEGYAERECGIDLTPDDDSPATSPDPEPSTEPSSNP